MKAPANYVPHFMGPFDTLVAVIVGTWIVCGFLNWILFLWFTRHFVTREEYESRHKEVKEELARQRVEYSIARRHGEHLPEDGLKLEWEGTKPKIQRKEQTQESAGSSPPKEKRD